MTSLATHSTPTSTTTTPSLSSRAVVAAGGNLRLAAEALKTTDAELLNDILGDSAFSTVVEAALALKRLELISSLTDHLLSTIDDMSPTEAGRLVTRLLEQPKAAAIAAAAKASTQPPVLVQNNHWGSDNNGNAPQSPEESARGRLAERLAAVAIPTTAS